MKILAIVGSMRKDKYTNMLVRSIIDTVKEEQADVTYELIYIGDMYIECCKVACAEFCKNGNYECIIKDDVSELLGKMIDADALIIGAPLYFRVPPAAFHTFAERLIALFYNKECQGSTAKESPLYGKPTALVGLAEYSNPCEVLDYLNDFCNILKLKALKIERFPYIGVGGQGDITEDKIFSPFECGKEIAKVLIKAKKE